MTDFEIPDDELVEESSAEELDHWVLTSGQAEALERIRSFAPKQTTGCQVGIINGCAGSGKSSMLRYLAKEDRIFVLCPTGKAAVRVKEVAGCDAMTIHRWLYKAVLSEQGEMEDWALRTVEEIQRPPRNVLLIDEASMITQTIYEDLLSICSVMGINIVFIGDGFQLPPVDSKKSIFSIFADSQPCTWKVLMTEVLRQAQDSVVLRAATMVRLGRPIYEAFAELQIVPESSLDEELLRIQKANGFVVCHTNKTRHELNLKVRKLLGFTDTWVEPQETLVVTRNSYDLDVFNGETYKVNSTGVRHTASVDITSFAKQRKKKVSAQYLNLDGIDRTLVGCREQVFGEIDPTFTDSNIDKGFRKWSKKQAFKNGGAAPDFVAVNFGYALTVHKMQGSQASEGLIVMEPTVRPEWGDGRKFVYTALTRAEKNVKIYYPEK